MSSSTEDFPDKLKEWKSASASLFLHATLGGMTVWAVGVLKHVSSAELHFGIEGIEGTDFLVTVNLSEARLAWVDNRDIPQFFSVGRPKTTFGKVLEIRLRGREGRIVFAELFPDTFDV